MPAERQQAAAHKGHRGERIQARELADAVEQQHRAGHKWHRLRGPRAAAMPRSAAVIKHLRHRLKALGMARRENRDHIGRQRGQQQTLFALASLSAGRSADQHRNLRRQVLPHQLHRRRGRACR